MILEMEGKLVAKGRGVGEVCACVCGGVLKKQQEDPCGPGTLLCLDCGGRFMNLHRR